MDPVDGWRKGVDFLLVSDASGKVGKKRYIWGIALLRLVLDIMLGQIGAMRARSVVERLRNHPESQGGFVKIGNSCLHVLNAAITRPNAIRLSPAEIAAWCQDCLPEKDAEWAAAYPTGICSVAPADYECLFRHGFEVADYTLAAYYPKAYQHMPYATFQKQHPKRA